MVAVSALSRVRGNPAQYRRYLLGGMTVMTFVGMGLAGDLTLTGHDLIRVLLGPGWETAGRIFTFFAPGIGVLTLYHTHGWIHLSIGRADRWFLWGIVECVTTCLLFICGLGWGPQGIAVAWCLSFWILIIPAMWYAGKPIDLGVTPILQATWRYIAASLVAGLLSWEIMVRWIRLPQVQTTLYATLRVSYMTISFVTLYLGAIVLLHGGFAPMRRLLGLLRDMVSSSKDSRSTAESGAAVGAQART
jgi:PST family polysaccharide transporter